MQQHRIFEEYAQELFEYGLQVIPVKPFKKACMITGYGKVFYDKKLKQKELDQYVASHGDWDIGIVCGEMSGVVAIDFDYVGHNDSGFLEQMLIGGLPQTPAIKKGKKGWTRFYRYNQNISKSFGLDRTPPGEDKSVRFVDVLSNKKITVIPPSRHSEGIDYEWIGYKPLHECLDDLPEINLSDIEHIRSVSEFNTQSVPEEIRPKAAKANQTRHSRLFGYVMRASNTESSAGELARKLLAYDVIINGDDKKGPYFKDTKNIGNKTPEQSSLSFVENICRWKAGKLKEKGIEWKLGQTTVSYWIKKGSDENPRWVRSDNYEDFAQFFPLKYPTARKDLVSGAVLYKDSSSGIWLPIENEIDTIKSYCHEVGLNQAHTSSALSRWTGSKNPQTLFDIRPWDGKDHIKELVSHMRFGRVGLDVAVDIFKDWLSGVFRRLYDPSKANRLVILRGAQGIGKDWIVNHMLKAFGMQHGEVSINPHNKVENFVTLHGLIAGYISEFDETKSVPLGMLKSLITSSSAMFRLPYDKRAQNRQLHYSLIASVNESSVLRDSTGNRRFVILDIDGIDWAYREKVNPQKIIDQAHHLYGLNFKASVESESVVRSIIEQETPDSSEVLFVEEVANLIEQERWAYASIMNARAKGEATSYASRKFTDQEFRLRWADISEKVAKISRNYGFKLKNAQTLLRKNGFTDRDSESTYYDLPQNIAKKH